MKALISESAESRTQKSRLAGRLLLSTAVTHL